MTNTQLTFIGYLLYLFAFELSYTIKWKNINWFAVFSFTIILGFRACGVDYNLYYSIFHTLINSEKSIFSPSFHLLVSEQISQFEMVYLILIKCIKFFCQSSIPFFCAIALCQILCLDNIIRKYGGGKIKFFLIYFFFTSLLFVDLFNAMRQLTAFLLFLNIIQYLVRKDWKHYFPLCFMLYFVHSSALFFIPLYFFVNRNLFGNELSQWSLYICVVFFSNLFIDWLSFALDELFTYVQGNEYLHVKYLQSDEQVVDINRSALVYLFRFSSVGYLIANKRKLQLHYGIFGLVLYNMTFIGFLLTEVSFNMGVSRINYYFYYCLFIVLGLSVHINLIKERGAEMIQTLYSHYIMVLYFAWFTNSVMQGAAGCAPYILSVDL